MAFYFFWSNIVPLEYICLVLSYFSVNCAWIFSPCLRLHGYPDSACLFVAPSPHVCGGGDAWCRTALGPGSHVPVDHGAWSSSQPTLPSDSCWSTVRVLEGEAGALVRNGPEPRLELVPAVFCLAFYYYEVMLCSSFFRFWFYLIKFTAKK